MIKLEINQEHLVDTFRQHTAEDHRNFSEIHNIIAEFKREMSDFKESVIKDKWMIIGATSVLIPILTVAANHFWS